MRELIYNITPEHDGMLIKDFLRNIHHYSTRQIIHIKKDVDSIRLNGEHVYVVRRLKAGDTLIIRSQDQPKEVITSSVVVPIAYEDEDVVVFDKPPHMPCHQSKIHQSDTLANCFAAHYAALGTPLTFRCVNRLDRDTSGLVLVAKNQHAAARLGFHTQKEYLAIVSGCISPSRGVIDAPIGREFEWEITRRVMENGQRAITRYECLCKNNEYSFVQLQLETGRTHQIRVHLSHIGHPLLGDELYGGDHGIIPRHALHCAKLRFISPVSGKLCCVTSKIHEDMQKALTNIGLSCAFE